MEENIDVGRGCFFNYSLSVAVYGVASIVSFKFNRNEGFKIGKRTLPIGTSEAYGVCGKSYDCAGGGGECGKSYDCAGGGGKCGKSYDCTEG